MGSFPSIAWPRIPMPNTSSLASITPSSRRNRSAIAHPKERITTQNSIDSHFHRLPTELLLEIDRYLAPEPGASSWSNAAARMALRATCRRFRAELSKPPGPDEPDANASFQRWPGTHRIAYSSLLRLAKFRRLCVDERAGRLEGDGRACFACRTSHVSMCFTPTEQMQEPEKRVCMGSQGLFEICPGYRITHSGLCARLRVNGISWDSSRNWGIRNYVFEGRPVEMKVRVRSFKEQGGKETKVETVLALGEIANKNDDETIIKALGKVNWRFCPHPCISDAGAWRLLLQDAEGARTAWLAVSVGFLRGCVSRRTVQPSWSTRTYVCATPDCDTRMTLLATHEKSGDTKSLFLYLKIERFLGKLRNGADERKWLAQIVQPSGSENDIIM